MNEFELIQKFFDVPVHDPCVKLSVGDDCALIAPSPGNLLAISTDTLNEGRHFFADVSPETLGHKVLAVNLSDMAAMGAKPRFALLSGSLPEANPDWLAAFSRGFFALAAQHKVSLIGGDTTKGARSFTVTILGDVPEGLALKRAGAKVGDEIWVSGQIGDAALALSALKGEGILKEADLRRLRARLETPTPRVALGLQLRGIASAAIDISDGLTGDLSHILSASKVGATIHLPHLPLDPILSEMLATPDTRSLALRCALSGGDDYELLFTAPPQAKNTLTAIASTLNISLTCIGVMTHSKLLTVTDEHHKPLAALPPSFDHFA